MFRFIFAFHDILAKRRINSVPLQQSIDRYQQMSSNDQNIVDG